MGTVHPDPGFLDLHRRLGQLPGCGRLTCRAAVSLTVGLLLTVLALMFLLNLAGGFIWPALLIVGGLVLLGTAFLPE